LIGIKGGAGNLWLGGSKVRGSGGRSPPEAEALSEKYVLIFYQKNCKIVLN